MESPPISPAKPPTEKHPPNVHSFAIKTTSALLSRSNSSPHSANHNRHHYVFSSPSRVAAGTRVRHRHSSSVEGEVHIRTIPLPWPTPPSVITASQDNLESQPTHRVRRAETMPSSTFKSDQKSGYVPELDSDLPQNPRQWNTNELMTYLNNARSASRDDANLAGILDYVRLRGLTGRELLRLTKTDLAGAALSDVQRAQLLECSRTLRADILRGRIYVDSYHSHEVSNNSNDIYSLSACSATPFHSVRGASVSVDDLRLIPDNNTDEDASAFSPSPFVTLHRSNSVSDVSVQRYRDLARMRMRHRGRVKGLVETWERSSTSGSECSASEDGSASGSDVESESEVDPQPESVPDGKTLESTSDLPSVANDEPPREVRSPGGDSSGISQESSSLTPPPPYTTMHDTAADEDEEPSIEELLASSSSISLKGARAWEADFGLGETVKRISVSAIADAENPSPLAIKSATCCGPKDNGQQVLSHSVRSERSGLRGSTGSIGRLAKTPKRVVTAIFTGYPSEDIPENVGNQLAFGDHPGCARSVGDVVPNEASASSTLQNNPDSALQALEESIAATRTQLETFRVRLEQVEADTARQELELKRVQQSDALDSSGFELKQRRSEASVQATVEVAGLPKDELIVMAVERWDTMSLCDITRAIVARAMGWLLPFGHRGIPPRDDQDQSHANTNSCPGVNDKRSLGKRGGGLPLIRMSCSIILVSFAICTAVLRRMGFGRWLRRP